MTHKQLHHHAGALSTVMLGLFLALTSIGIMAGEASVFSNVASFNVLSAALVSSPAVIQPMDNGLLASVTLTSSTTNTSNWGAAMGGVLMAATLQQN